MGKNDDQSHQDRWARLRFAIVGPMLAAPPATGELRPALKALSTKVWRHPISGLDVRFGASTIERWYYSARAAPLDPVSVLRQQVRSDSGRFRSLTPLAMDTLDAQYRKCPHWTVQQHLHNLCIALADSHSPSPSYASIRRYFEARGMSRQTQQHRSSSVDARKRWHEWIYLLMRDVAPDVSGSKLIGPAILAENLLGKHFQRRKALVALANEQGFTNIQICEFLGVSEAAVCRYLKKFRAGGAENLFLRKIRTLKENDEELKKSIFCLLHEPPSLSGVNRTTWKMADIKKVLEERGIPVCLSIIRKVIKNAGFRWRMARVVLTSTDSAYREKLDYIHEVLANLKENERFFSIDEYGPFAIRITGGRILVPPGTQPTVPQWQKSKGRIIMTAALELSRNQMTHFYSDYKNTAEMIRMAKVLAQKYHETSKIYLSWDSASWHMSKELLKFGDRPLCVRTK